LDVGKHGGHFTHFEMSRFLFIKLLILEKVTESVTGYDKVYIGIRVQTILDLPHFKLPNPRITQSLTIYTTYI
jgi:hypothetical protein